MILAKLVGLAHQVLALAGTAILLLAYFGEQALPLSRSLKTQIAHVARVLVAQGFQAPLQPGALGNVQLPLPKQVVNHRSLGHGGFLLGFEFRAQSVSGGALAAQRVESCGAVVGGFVGLALQRLFLEPKFRPQGFCRRTRRFGRHNEQGVEQASGLELQGFRPLAKKRVAGKRGAAGAGFAPLPDMRRNDACRPSSQLFMDFQVGRTRAGGAQIVADLFDHFVGHGTGHRGCLLFCVRFCARKGCALQPMNSFVHSKDFAQLRNCIATYKIIITSCAIIDTISQGK